MINLVERLQQIDSTEICCKALRDPTINNITNSINCVRTTDPFVEPELIILRLSNLQNRTDGNPSKVIAGHGLGATVFNFNYRHDITTFKTNRNAAS